MIRVALVDDEKPALDELEYLLKEKDIEVIGCFTDPVEARKKIIEKKPDTIFIDINMPVINGYNLAKELLKVNKFIGIVFVTALNENDAVNQHMPFAKYLFKPVSKEKLNRILDEIRSARR